MAARRAEERKLREKVGGADGVAASADLVEEDVDEEEAGREEEGEEGIGKGAVPLAVSGPSLAVLSSLRADTPDRPAVVVVGIEVAKEGVASPRLPARPSHVVMPGASKPVDKRRDDRLGIGLAARGSPPAPPVGSFVLFPCGWAVARIVLGATSRFAGKVWLEKKGGSVDEPVSWREGPCRRCSERERVRSRAEKAAVPPSPAVPCSVERSSGCASPMVFDSGGGREEGKKDAPAAEEQFFLRTTGLNRRVVFDSEDDSSRGLPGTTRLARRDVSLLALPQLSPLLLLRPLVLVCEHSDPCEDVNSNSGSMTAKSGAGDALVLAKAIPFCEGGDIGGEDAVSFAAASKSRFVKALRGVRDPPKCLSILTLPLLLPLIFMELLAFALTAVPLLPARFKAVPGPERLMPPRPTESLPFPFFFLLAVA